MKQLSKVDVLIHYLIAETTKHMPHKNMVRLISGLCDDEIKEWAKGFSEERKNGVYKNVMKRKKWYITTLDVKEYPYLKVGDINKKVKPLLNGFQNDVSDIWASHGWRVNDPALRVHPEFKSQGKIEERHIIALKFGKRYRIIDGSHRAVRMALDGVHKFSVIYAEEYSTLKRIWYRIKKFFSRDRKRTFTWSCGEGVWASGTNWGK